MIGQVQRHLSSMREALSMRGTVVTIRAMSGLRCLVILLLLLGVHPRVAAHHGPHGASAPPATEAPLPSPLQPASALLEI